MSAISVRIKSKAYGNGEDTRLAISGLSFDVQDGELVCLLGPSGAGKTTTLNIIAGLDTRFEGEVRISGPKESKLAYVFQNPRLLPWRTLLENVVLPLKGRHDAIPHAAAWLDRAGLGGAHNLYPGQASLGMQRRAALARAFAMEPTILLMDEAFVSLDETSAAGLRELFAGLWKSERVTTVFVTHNVAEAAELATRVLIYSAAPARIAGDLELPYGNGTRDLQNSEHLLRKELERIGLRSPGICTSER